MPLTRTVVAAAGKDYTSPFVGPVDHTDVVKVDVSALTTDEVDADGVLKTGVALKADGTLVSRAPGLKQALITGGAAGDHTVTGIATSDKLVSVYHYTPGSASAFADLTGEFTISAADTINNAGGTSTASDTLLVTYVSDAEYVFGVVLEAVKVATGNTSALLTAATDIEVAVAVIGQVNRDIAEDNLGRAYTANEVLAFDAAASRLRLMQT